MLTASKPFHLVATSHMPLWRPMLNYYHLLCIHPTASRSDIQAALDKQQALGKLPPATLKLAADTLLSPENRQVYDAQLSALP